MASDTLTDIAVTWNGILLSANRCDIVKEHFRVLLIYLLPLVSLRSIC
jgi:hypothetical protein